MKSDLDRLMEEREIDAFIIRGSENEDMRKNYITNGVHASATVVKKRGEDPVLIVNGMEVDEAKKSGYEVITPNDLGYFAILKQYKDDPVARNREYYRNILNHFSISGRLALYGMNDTMNTFKFMTRFQADFADVVELVEDEEIDIFMAARRTKDADELEQLRESGRRSGLAMTRTREWLSTMRADGDTVVDADGNPVTIGDVKRYVRQQLMELDMEDSQGMIFAQGADAGMPHSRGEADEVLKVGQAIVFDLFPRPIGGGYFHDMTRTWSLGHATEEVEEAHRLVMHAFTQSLEALTLGEPTRQLQELVCDIFEEHGHPTPRNTPGTSSGYVHSLGHGLGLNVHEAPGMGNYTPERIVFEVGDVVTIEPGLYYPEKGWGIRIEDSVYVAANGELINLTNCTYDLVVPLQG